MSDETPLLGLPLILPAQAQKHVTHNEGLALLDALVQPAVLTFGSNTPPAVPAEGDRHVTGPAPTGVWAGQAGKLALFEGAIWRFLTPREGWTVQIPSQQSVAIYESGAWRLPGSRPISASRVGVGTTADATNVLSVAGPATLLSSAGSGGHQVKVNKTAAGDTASLLFQTGFSGRAEMGTIGSDNFAVKVSADGSTFNDAIVIPAADASVSTPGGLRLPDGSPATPGLRFAADTDTGLHRPAANTLGLVAGGTVRATLSDTDLTVSVPANATRLGVGTTADAVNVLKSAGPATLLTHAGSGGHQARVNKATVSDNASIQFQTGLSGRAEVGTLGSDNFSVRVSNDGTTFADAIVIPVADASLSAPGGVQLPDGSAATPGLRFAADADTGLHRPAANTLAMVTAGVVRAQLSDTALQVDLPVTGTAVTASATDATAGRLLRVGDFGLGGLTGDVSAGAASLPSRFARFDADANTPDSTRWHGIHIQKANTDGQGAQLAVREGGTAGVLAVRNRGAGTPGTWSAWNVMFGRTNILATVSQTSGVPTGGLIESGTSANGLFRRFACGLQICWRLDLSAATVNTATGSLFRSASVTWTFPATFIAAPVVSGQADPVDMWMTGALPTTTNVALRLYSPTSVATATSFRATAIGRWF